MTVVVVGGIISDVVARLRTTASGPLEVGTDTPAEIRISGGGSGANTAHWLAFAGAPVTLVACVGDDAAGRERVTELTAAGVHCAVRFEPSAGTGTVVVLSDHHERTMVSDRGANRLLAPADVDAGLAASPDARHMHLSGYPLFDASSRPAGLRALAAAREAGLTTSVDVSSAAPIRKAGVREFTGWIRDTDLLLANLDEARTLTGDQESAPADLARALTEVAAEVVVKLGADGAVWAGRDRDPVQEPADQVELVDPTGAGDAFTAGLLAARLAGVGVAEALRAGARLGARAVTQLGARPA